MPKKLIVAIHGIGDQIRHETAQSVAFRFFDYYDLPPALPLGRFYGASPEGLAVMEAPGNPQLAFAEAYWANVPRKLVKDGYTLEEAKRWARTIVARLNLRAWQTPRGSGLTRRQYRMLEAVLDEMIDTVFVLDNLTFLADRAGIFKFDLKKTLDDYLNDVQVVTEFQKYRHRIVGGLDSLIREIESDGRFTDAEIYVVGHSEGSVVALLGLLEAMSRTTGVPDWVYRVRGMMTIGSPIEPHQILWEDLWSFSPTVELAKPIVWWNYFDFGDPIAYRLDRTRSWLAAHGWQGTFDFPPAHDVGFSRYPLPGKAHVDYWHDRGVFDHFIDNVVKPDPAPPRPPSAPRPKRRRHPAPRPTSKLQGFIGRPLPFVLSIVLLFLGVFALYKPIQDALQPDPVSVAGAVAAGAAIPSGPRLAGSDTLKNLIGFTWILAAMTAAVRVPRLTRAATSPRLWVVVALFCVAGFYWYPSLVHVVTRQLIDEQYASIGWRAGDSMALRISVAAIMAIASLWSFARPKRGVAPVLTLGTALVGLLVAGLLKATDDSASSLWPVVVGGAFFLYLWWLAALLFDLSIVWHTYVRYSAGIESMREMVGHSNR